MKKYHVFIWQVSARNIDQVDMPGYYRGSFDTLLAVMEYRFTPHEIENCDMRQYRAGCYMVLEDGSLSLVRFAYCSKQSPWGSWYDVAPHPDYGFASEER